MVRCSWCSDDPLYIAYHDNEWGVPLYDDRRLFEMLCLEGAQAGLSWLTVLKKRENYRRAFANFEWTRVARYGAEDIHRLLQDPGIIRNRLKVNAFVSNARAMEALLTRYDSLATFLWNYVDGETIQNHWQTAASVPAETVLSKQLSKDLKQLGFRFVGPTICYAYMQSVGLVNDHTLDCFRYQELH